MKNVSEDLEFQIIHSCAPVLVGIKPAGMFAVSRDQYPYLTRNVRVLNKKLNSSGLYFLIICRCSAHELLFVYNKSKVNQILKDCNIQSYLLTKGYEQPFTVEKSIFQLQSAFFLREGFPHEVGIFLGYPLADVIGFEKNKGKNFKCCGFWKVYGNISDAYNRFFSYSKCTNSLMYLYATGKKTFEELCLAA